MDLFLEENFKITLDEFGGRLELWQFSAKDKVWKTIDDEYLSETMRKWKDKIQLEDLMLKEGV